MLNIASHLFGVKCFRESLSFGLFTFFCDYLDSCEVVHRDNELKIQKNLRCRADGEGKHINSFNPIIKRITKLKIRPLAPRQTNKGIVGFVWLIWEVEELYHWCKHCSEKTRVN